MRPEAALADRVRAALRRRIPVDDRERVSIDRTLAELDRLAHPFDRDADLVHVTGSGFVVGQRGIVLLLHRRLGIWVQPGGHIDAGETPWDAARREVEEETGLRVRHLDLGADGEPALAHVDVHAGGRGHTHLDLRYRFEAPGDPDPDPPVDESQDVGWYSWTAAVDLAEPAMTAILEELALAR